MVDTIHARMAASTREAHWSVFFFFFCKSELLQLYFVRQEHFLQISDCLNRRGGENTHKRRNFGIFYVIFTDWSLITIGKTPTPVCLPARPRLFHFHKLELLENKVLETHATGEVHHLYSDLRHLRSCTLVVTQQPLLEGNKCAYQMNNSIA